MVVRHQHRPRLTQHGFGKLHDAHSVAGDLRVHRRAHGQHRVRGEEQNQAHVQRSMTAWLHGQR
eukprot:1159467-Pelagomonas_calceolata.AAC.11